MLKKLRAIFTQSWWLCWCGGWLLAVAFKEVLEFVIIAVLPIPPGPYFHLRLVLAAGAIILGCYATYRGVTQITETERQLDVMKKIVAQEVVDKTFDKFREIGTEDLEQIINSDV